MLPSSQKAGHKPLAVLGIMMRVSNLPYLNDTLSLVKSRAEVKSGLAEMMSALVVPSGARPTVALAFE